MATVVFRAYFGRSEEPQHLRRAAGETIYDPSYFGPTHKELLRRGASRVMVHTTVSAAMDCAAHKALWTCRLFEDREKGGLFIVDAEDNLVTRIGEHRDGLLRVHHECDKCDSERVHCCHVPAAVCCYEAACFSDSPMRALIRKIRSGPAPSPWYEGRREKAYIRLMDELYYTMRHVRAMDRNFWLLPADDNREALERHGGAELEPGGGPPRGRSRKGGGAPSRGGVDWSRYALPGELTAGEEGMVPRGVYYVDRSGEERLATEVVGNADPLLIMGPAGTGKSRLARRVFEHLRLPMLVISASADRDYYSLVASTALKDGSTLQVEAKLLTAARRGYGLLIEEVSSLRPDRAIILNSILQERELDLGTGTTRLHPRCRIIATANEGDCYAGSGGLDPSTFDRFVPLYLDYLDRETEALVVEAESENRERETVRKMVALAAESRNLYRLGELSRPITTRDCIRWAKYSRTDEPVLVAKRMLLPSAAGDEREMVTLREHLDNLFP